jgi:NAD(P)-dependent dehydrogenase (short-subunit alcohol dehydrogenase family)
LDDLIMAGKRVLLTGGTDGIGKEAARQLARMGADLVIVGRDPQKTASAIKEIGAEASGGEVGYLLADLSSQAQVRTLAHEYQERYSRLDVLINNAGTSFLRRQLSEDGIEMTFAVNHLAYFILTNLLLEPIKASAPARIVNTSSSAHYRDILDFDDLNMEKNYWFMRAYSQSKLGNVLFTYALARRLEGCGVTANALHPGFVRTNVARDDNGWLVKLLQPLIFHRGIPVEQGAATTVYLASSPEVEGVSGKFYADCGEKRSSPLSYNQEVQERLWRVSGELTGLASL